MRARLGEYVRMSTANPTGWRPWNSRLSFYLPNSFPLPRGLGAADMFPNFPGIRTPATWITHGGYPAPIYAPPRPLQLSGPAMVQAIPGSSLYVPAQYGGRTFSVPMMRYLPAPAGVAPAPTVPTPTASPLPVATGSPVPPSNAILQQRRNRWQMNPNGQPGFTPITSTPATGGVTQPIGYDAAGNPIYATTTPSTAAAQPATNTSGTDGSTPSWFSQDSLGLGLNNGVYAGAALLLALLFTRKGGR